MSTNTEKTNKYNSANLIDQLNKRILVLDGAMGTMVQSFALDENDFRGSILSNHPGELMGNNELLSLTKPEVIESIHRSFLKAGADIIETNTFNGNRISQSDFSTENLIHDMNFAAARIARKVADETSQVDPDKPRFVCGALGPTNKMASLSPDIQNPQLRSFDFDDFKDAYYEQAIGLIEGGVDCLMVETVFDTLNAKAALVAIDEAFTVSGSQLPLMISVTITDASGRTLSGQTVEAFWSSVNHANLLTAGINCALGAELIEPYLKDLARICDRYVSVHPNAGLPNELGEYDESPEITAEFIGRFCREGLVNIVGGCCGTTPEHIRAMTETVQGITPRKF
ncbi:MAG: homocysteine S-methyltransferase family protein [Candidatus Neomarinimicrobiota bacterium]